MTKQNVDVTTWYKGAFKAWPKAVGDKPTADQLTVAHAFGRPGKQSLGLALAMRDGGVTGGQIAMACGAAQNNHRTKVIKVGWFKRLPASPGADGHTVYRIELTAKGQAKLAKVAAAVAADTAVGDAAPAKAKRKASKRKAKVNTVDAPATAPVDVQPAPEAPAHTEA